MNRIESLWWRLVRFGFRLLYNEMAFSYDLVSQIVSLGAWRCWQRAALNHLPDDIGDGVVLEIAHGTGNLQLDMRRAGYHTIGYDLSPYMGRIAQRKLLNAHYTPHLARGMAQQLPFADESVAAVISTFPTDFIMQAGTLAEVRRILQSDGRFIIVPNGTFTGGGLLRNFLEWLYRITGQREDRTLPTIEAIFEGHGFAVDVFFEDCPRSRAQVVVLSKAQMPLPEPSR